MKEKRGGVETRRIDWRKMSTESREKKKRNGQKKQDKDFTLQIDFTLS